MNRFVLAALATPALSVGLAPLFASADTGASSSDCGTVEYTVRGRNYCTLDSAEGFRERGIASWYGSMFHGRDTASGEPFDMHALTAAHPYLPLHTSVRVSDVRTGATVVVKINDRGPFADDRVIDLSRAAAQRLGMIDSGTTEVTIEALGAKSAHQVSSADPAAAPAAFVQLGAFAERANADALAQRAQAYVSQVPDIEHDVESALYRVRVGPFEDAASLRAALEGLAAAGLDARTVRATSR